MYRMCKSTCIHNFSSASPVDSPCVHDISSASPVVPPCLHDISSPSPVDLPVAVAYAHRYYRRCGIGISIFYFSICTLCCVNVLHMFALSATRSAIFVQPFYLIINAWNLRFRSAAYAGFHGNFRLVVSPLVANSPISAPSVRLICAQSFFMLSVI